MKRPIFSLVFFYTLAFIFVEKTKLNFILALFLIAFFVILIYFNLKRGLICLVVFVIAFIRTAAISSPLKEYEGKHLKSFYATVIEKKTTAFNKNYILKINYNRDTFYASFKASKDFKIGDILIGEGSFERPPSQDNFRSFSYRQYLKTKKVFLTAKKISLFDSGKDSLFLLPRRYFINYIEQNLKKYTFSSDFDFAVSVVLGQKRMDQDTIDQYSKLGLSHILAVSGLHISILILFLEIIGKHLGVKRKTYSLIILLVLLFYSYVIGFPISLIRALSMYAVRSFAIFFNKLQDRLNDIGLAFFLCLLINPFYLYSSALYFSFSAIFSVIYLSDLLKKNIRLGSRNLDSVISGLSIQIGMLPIQIMSYSSLNLLSFLLNLIVLPLAFVPVLASFIVGIVPGIISFIPSLILTGSLQLMNKLMDFFSSWTMLTLSFSYFSIVHVFFYYFVIITLLTQYKRPKKKRKIIWFSNIFILMTIVSFQLISNQITLAKVNFIDVGQGDAILIRSHGRSYMVDLAGDYLRGEKAADVLIDYLHKEGVYSLDGLFLTHDDFDHMGNYKYLANRLEIKRIYANQDIRLVPKELITILEPGDKVDYKDLIFEVMGEVNKLSSNESSMGLRVSIASTKLLFTADIEEGEMNLASQEVDVLKVSHHGADNASSRKFLEKIKPKYAIISVGQKNRYGHPSKRVLNDLDDLGVKTYTTSKNGNVELRIFKNDLKIKSYYLR